MSMNDLIKLNVGGHIFETYRSTLLSSPGSMISNILDPESDLPPAKLQDGAYFIESCPHIFGVILNYLRYKSLMTKSGVRLESVREVGKYFGLKELVGLIDENEVIKINVGGKYFETHRSTLLSAPGSVISNMFDPESTRPPAKLQESGAYFIDGCPEMFGVILYYLKNKSLMASPGISLASIRQEAMYYSLKELVDLVDVKRMQKEAIVRKFNLLTGDYYGDKRSEKESEWRRVSTTKVLSGNIPTNTTVTSRWPWKTPDY